MFESSLRAEWEKWKTLAGSASLSEYLWCTQCPSKQATTEQTPWVQSSRKLMRSFLSLRPVSWERWKGLSQPIQWQGRQLMSQKRPISKIKNKSDQWPSLTRYCPDAERKRERERETYVSSHLFPRERFLLVSIGPLECMNTSWQVASSIFCWCNDCCINCQWLQLRGQGGPLLSDGRIDKSTLSSLPSQVELQKERERKGPCWPKFAINVHPMGRFIFCLFSPAPFAPSQREVLKVDREFVREKYSLKSKRIVPHYYCDHWLLMLIVK